jgi:RimJ/RimL family protein N-acetyltransferase
MTLRVTKFTDEFAQVARWTGESEQRLRADQDYHSEDRDHWLAWDGDRVVGALHPWVHPDGRHRLYYDACRTDAYVPLADVIPGECLTMVNVSDAEMLDALVCAGFMEERRENLYKIPIRIPIAHVDAEPPANLKIITADQTELEPLMLLDCALRADIPGSEGWQPDPVWFREETYDSPFFNPQSYRVALDGDAYVGLARVWETVPGQEHRRLGAVGILAPYRRLGLARVLIAQALSALADAPGTGFVTAEVDSTNQASHALMTSFAGEITGATVELRRPAR